MRRSNTAVEHLHKRWHIRFQKAGGEQGRASYAGYLGTVQHSNTGTVLSSFSTSMDGSDAANPAEESVFEQCVADLISRYRVYPGLDTIRLLLNALGDVQRHVRCVHVAGTNGKGSVSRKVAEALATVFDRNASVCVGLFSSPHIAQITERISVNGVCISRQDFVRLYRRVISIVDNVASTVIREASCFDILTAMAFLYFYEGPSDVTSAKSRPYCSVAVVEVGLGGRLDATNIIERPLCAVITSIGWDHMQFLGDTLESIAHEKAGILKSGSPVVLGCQALGFSAIENQIVSLCCRPIVRVMPAQCNFERFDHENRRIARCNN